jgi:hypothetical protein
MAKLIISNVIFIIMSLVNNKKTVYSKNYLIIAYILSISNFLKSHYAINCIVSAHLVLFSIIKLNSLFSSSYIKELRPICL